MTPDLVKLEILEPLVTRRRVVASTPSLSCLFEEIYNTSRVRALSLPFCLTNFYPPRKKNCFQIAAKSDFALITANNSNPL